MFSKWILIFTTVVAVELMFLVMSLLLLGNTETQYTPTSVDGDPLFCGIIVNDNVGAWYCPVILAAA